MNKNYIYIGLYLGIATATTAGSDGREVVGMGGDTDNSNMVAVLYYDPQRDVICIPAPPPPPPKPEQSEDE